MSTSIQKKRALVTGGAGFVGSNLANELQKRNVNVTILDNLSSGLISNLEGLDVNFCHGDILDFDLVCKLVEKSDVVFHLAARGSVPRSISEPHKTFEVNFNGSLNILEAARKNRTHVIFSSSSSVYGSNETLPKNEFDWVAPLSPYAASKLATEGAISAYMNSYGVPTCIFRFFNIYGRLQRFDHPYAAVIPRWIHQAENNKPLTVFGDGEHSRDFTHISSVVSVLVKSMEEKISSPLPINLAFGQTTTLNKVLKIFGTYYPELKINYESKRAGDVAHSSNSPERLVSLFGDIKSLPLNIGIAETISWYRELKLGEE